MSVVVQPLGEDRLDEAERVFRLAFGTFLGVREPLQFTGDCAYVRTRWQADPTAAWAALLDGRLAGTNFATRWGSFAFFGPLSVRPEWWERGIARRLLEVTMQRFEEWGVRHAGLYTFGHSPKHVALYQRYGFLPHYLTAIVSKSVAADAAVSPDECRSALTSAQRAAARAECAAVTDAIFAGLDVGREIDAVQNQALGDTLLLRGDRGLRGFAVCHVGPGTEAGDGVCYAKFAAVAPGAGAAPAFDDLLRLCERYAALRGAAQLVTGINTARAPAYRALLARGFRAYALGVAMQRPDAPGFNRPDAWVLDDWR
ncbi:GNAT family N-acetyltransferase [bacterium]|nr:GNAT family N-acetyltransferase [bacterium]